MPFCPQISRLEDLKALVATDGDARALFEGSASPSGHLLGPVAMDERLGMRNIDFVCYIRLALDLIHYFQLII